MGQRNTSIKEEKNKKDTREFDPNFHGPVSKRSCTDVICGIIFLIFILVFIIVGICSFVIGDARLIIFPKDSDGKICGLDYPNRKFLVFFDITTCLKLGCNTPQVCVEKCPTESWSLKQKNTDDRENRKKMICKSGTNALDDKYASKTIDKLVTDKECAPFVLKSKSVFWRCIPNIDNIKTLVSDKLISADKSISNSDGFIKSTGQILNYQSVTIRVAYDLLRTWKFILLGLFIAAILCMLWLLIMRFFTAIVVYMTLLLFLVLFSAGSVCCFIRWRKIKSITAADNVSIVMTQSSAYLNQATTWLILGIISGLGFFIILIIIVFLRKRIQLAIAIFQETSRAVQSMMFTLLWPIVPFFLIMCVIFYGVFVEIHLRSLIANFKENEACKLGGNALALKICKFLHANGTKYVILLQVFNIFMLIWLVNFVKALGEMTLAGAFATYYFAQDNPDEYMPKAPVLKSFGVAIFYHLGSLAFGSILITLFSIVRSILLFVERRLKLSENPVAQFCTKCMCCCFWLLESILRFLNRNAYIMVAIYSHNFCRSASDAFALISRNLVRVFVVDNVTNFVLFVGKLVIAGLTGILAYFCFEGTFAKYHGMFAVYEPKLNYPLIPVFFVVLGSFIISKIFFSVYEMGIDTIFICFCEDLERNDGSPEKPYFMRSSLMEKLGKPEDSEKSKLIE